MNIYRSVVLIPFFALLGCGDSSHDHHDHGSMEKSGQSMPAADPATLVETVDGLTTVRISGNDRMKFDLEAFTVTSGQTVRVIFSNEGSMPKAAMGHNVVFLKSDVDTNAFVTAAAKARDYDYIPQDKLDEILATTNLLGPGESDTIEFTAPEPGEYTYVCSFPAHLFAGMVGVMEVVAAE